MYQISNLTPRVSDHISLFGLAFFVLKPQQMSLTHWNACLIPGPFLSESLDVRRLPFSQERQLSFALSGMDFKLTYLTCNALFIERVKNSLYLNTVFKMVSFIKTPGNTPYNGLYGEAPPERGIFSRLQVYERVGILLGEVYKRVGKSVIRVCERTQKGYRLILWLYEVEKTFFVWVWFLFKWQCIYS